MPRGDRTGPEGQGPMTGRGLGFCSGSDQPGALQGGPGPGYGRGRGWFGGRGFGRGSGFGWGFGRSAGRRQHDLRTPDTPASSGIREPESDRDQEIGFLKTQLETLQTELADIQQRLSRFLTTED